MKIELNVEGMKCEGCVRRIKKALSSIKGIVSYNLSLENKKLIAEVKKEKVIEEIIEKVEGLGFHIFK